MNEKRSALFLSTVGFLVVGCGPTAFGPDEAIEGMLASNSRAPVVTQTAPILDDFGTGAGVTGEATMTRTSEGIRVDGSANGLVAGDTYTLWIAIFENSHGCGEPGCGLSDLGKQRTQATIMNFGGFVADGTGDFEAHLDRHDPGAHQILGGTGRPGVDNTYLSELHVILRSHGEAEEDLADLAEQLSMVGAFCNLPTVGCEDQGVMIFNPPVPPGRS